MVIQYCDSCGMRVSDEEIQSGSALQGEENKVYCPKCAPARFVSDSGRKKSSKILKPVVKGNSERRIPAASTGDTTSAPSPASVPAPHPSSGRAVPSPAQAPAASNGVIIGVVATIAVVGGLLMMLSSASPPKGLSSSKLGSNEEPKPIQPVQAAKPHDSERPAAPRPSTADPAPSTKESDGEPATLAAPIGTAELGKDADEELQKVREGIAARRLAEAKAFLEKSPHDLMGFQEKFSDLLITYRSTASGEEAARVAAAIEPTPTTAAFVRIDTSTQGNWKNIYGRDGHYLTSPTPVQLPPSVKITQSLPVSTWKVAEELRTLQLPKSDTRRASGWYDPKVINMTVQMPEQPGYRVALYFINHDGSKRQQTLELLDSKDNVLQKQELDEYRNGLYVIYDVSGPFKIRITKKSGTNAVISAIFFDPIGKDAPPPGTVAEEKKPDSGKAAPGPDSSADEALVEYERVLGEAHAQMRAFDSRDAIALLEKAKSDKRLGAYQSKIDSDIELAKGLNDFSKSVLAGAAVLADKRAFTLMKADGEQFPVGGSSKNTVTGTKNTCIEIEKKIGGGKLTMGIEIDQLAPASRLELATLAGGTDPEALTHLAFATLVLLENGGADITAKQARQRHEAALKVATPSQKAQLEHIAERLDAYDREQNAEPALKALDALMAQKKWEEAEAFLAKYQRDYLGSRALLRLKPLIEKKAAEIDAQLHPPKPGLWASYWSIDSKGAAKSMVLARAENTINFTLGTANSPDPAVPNDFGMRMGGFLKIDKDATYHFQGKADDRIIVWIDGKEIFSGTTNKEVKASVLLTRGNHDFKLWFADTGGAAGLVLNWKSEGEKTYQPVPFTAFFYDERRKEQYQKE